MGVDLADGSDRLERFAGRFLIFFENGFWKFSTASVIGDVEGWLIDYRP